VTVNTHYTFGDVDRAADRLRLLAGVFEPSLVDFLRRAELTTATRVLDLGCGPGYTTSTLFRLLKPHALIGVDGSERFLERARKESPPEIDYRHADVTTADFADLDVDVAYSRFLLTHLPNPGDVLSRWAPAIRPGGRLLLQETAQLTSPHPTLARYYELVDVLQRRHGQSLHIGRDLSALVDRTRYRIVRDERTPIAVTAPQMAELHAMNIQTWRHDAQAKDFDPAEIDRLERDLHALASEESSRTGIVYEMGEMVLEPL
jgi:SAM-dependent methyltransferase